jgi:chemotaxis protein histidine kinase CheA
MSATHDALERRLLPLFAEEAHGLLAHIDAVLAELVQAGAAGQAAPLRALLDIVHALKDAALAVAPGDLEYLRHSIDSVFAAAARSNATLQPDQLAVIGRAIELAGRLLEKPASRVRNQALNLIGQLDGVARAGGSPHLPRIRSLTR